MGTVRKEHAINTWEFLIQQVAVADSDIWGVALAWREITCFAGKMSQIQLLTSPG